MLGQDDGDDSGDDTNNKDYDDSFIFCNDILASPGLLDSIGLRSHKF